MLTPSVNVEAGYHASELVHNPFDFLTLVLIMLILSLGVNVLNVLLPSVNTASTLMLGAGKP